MPIKTKYLSLPYITLLAAVGRNGVIGRDGDLAWRHPLDLARVKELTTGKTLIMGRRTFESIGRALPDRRSLVLTRSEDWSAPGAEVVHSLTEALLKASGEPAIGFGGGEVYEQLMPLASILEITEIGTDLEGDVHFPTIQRRYWTEHERTAHDGFDFVTYRRHY